MTIVIECRHGMPDFLCRRCHPELNARNAQPFAASAAPALSEAPRDFYQPKSMSNEEWDRLKREKALDDAKRSLATLEARDDLDAKPNLRSLVQSLRRKIEQTGAAL